jgi:hypothetical protein
MNMLPPPSWSNFDHVHRRQYVLRNASNAQCHVLRHTSLSAAQTTGLKVAMIKRKGLHRQRPNVKRRTIPSFFGGMDRGNPCKVLVTTSVIAANIQAGYRPNRSTTSPRQPTDQKHALSQTTRPFFFNPPKSQIHAIINYLKFQFEPNRKHSTISIININWLMWLRK